MLGFITMLDRVCELVLPFPFFIQVLGQRVEAAVQERHGVQELEVVEGEGDKTNILMLTFVILFN